MIQPETKPIRESWKGFSKVPVNFDRDMTSGNNDTRRIHAAIAMAQTNVTYSTNKATSVGYLVVVREIIRKETDCRFLRRIFSGTSIRRYVIEAYCLVISEPMQKRLRICFYSLRNLHHIFLRNIRMKKPVVFDIFFEFANVFSHIFCGYISHIRNKLRKKIQGVHLQKVHLLNVKCHTRSNLVKSFGSHLVILSAELAILQTPNKNSARSA